MPDGLTSSYRAGSRIGHIASNNGFNGMMGQTRHAHTGGGFMGNLSGIGGDVSSAVGHVGQLSSGQGLQGLVGLAGDAVSAVRHGMGAIKAVA
jgi:hypothetical protein